MLLAMATPALAITTATVCLVDSSGNGIAGAQAEFRFGSWQIIGPTGVDGCVSTDSSAAVGNRSFRVTYNGQTTQKTQNTSIDPMVAFNTILVTGQLIDSTGTGIAGALIQYNAGGWNTLGTTDDTGRTSGEMLPANRSFRVTYNGQTTQKTQNTSIDPMVAFNTILVTGQLIDSTGTGIAGALIQYNAGGWNTLGTTDDTGRTSGEMLPANRSFRVTYNGQTTQKTQNTSMDPVVGYQTGQVLQGTGARVLRYRASGWRPFFDGIELLPGDVVFDLDAGPNQTHTVVAGAATYVPTAPTPPVVDAGPDLTGDEGALFQVSSAYTDAEITQSHTAVVDWGDGSAPESGVVTAIDGLTGQVDAAHVYADEGIYTVTVCVTDNGNPDATGCAARQVTVANVAPAVLIDGPASADLGTEVTLNSLVSDPGPGDTASYEWVVTRDEEMVAGGTDSTFAFTPQTVGEYLVTLTVDDGDGGIGSAAMVFTATHSELEEPLVEPSVDEPDPVEETEAPDQIPSGEPSNPADQTLAARPLEQTPADEPGAPHTDQQAKPPARETEPTPGEEQHNWSPEVSYDLAITPPQPDSDALPGQSAEDEVAALYMSADTADGRLFSPIDEGPTNSTTLLLIAAAFSVVLGLLARRRAR